VELRRRAASDRQPGVLLALAIGGALGAPARYELTQLVHVAKGSFPWATFWINVSGAFVLGAFLTIAVERVALSRYLRVFFATGFLGAYTTFSTMAVDTATLWRDGHVTLGLLYLVASMMLGCVAAYAGVVIARRIPLARDRETSC
jgi:fluoride exporter